MIDRGALILGPHPSGRYRGVHRTPLDGQRFTGRKGRALAKRYADALVAGEGVIEDLDDAMQMLAGAAKMGIEDLEVVVFEVPHEPTPTNPALALVPNAPAEGLVLLGHDVFEPIEPYASPLACEAPDCRVNDAGLIDRRADAEAYARAATARGGFDEALVVARIWGCSGTKPDRTSLA
jgi:hypothetical protein